MRAEEMNRLVKGVDVIAEKIRILFDAGAERSEIARFLEISYQHVHNVLKRSNRLATRTESPDSAAIVFQLRVEKGGGITLPRDFIESQDLDEGDVLICREEAGNLVIMSRAAAVEAVREIARKRMPEEAGLLDALLAPSNRTS